MNNWEAHRTIILSVVAALLLLLLTSWAVSRLIQPGVELLTTTKEELQDELISERPKRSRHGVAAPAMETYLNFLIGNNGRGGENDRLKANKEELMRALEVSFPSWVKAPGGVAPADWFSMQHAKIGKQLYEEGINKNVGLQDKRLGFSIEMIENLNAREAPENLKKLAMVEKLVQLLMDARVSRILTVVPEDFKTTGAIRPAARGSATDDKNREVVYYERFIREYPVRIVVVTPIDALMRFLHSVRQREQFLMIRNISIRNRQAEGLRPGGELAKMGEDELWVTITAAGMSFLSKAEIKANAAQQRLKGGTKRRAIPKRPVKPIGA